MTENPTLSRVLFIYWVFFGYVLFIVYLLAEWKSKKKLLFNSWWNEKWTIEDFNSQDPGGVLSCEWEFEAGPLQHLQAWLWIVWIQCGEVFFVTGQIFQVIRKKSSIRVLVWITTATASQHQEEWILRSKNETREDKFKIVPMHLKACSLDILYKCIKLQRRS